MRKYLVFTHWPTLTNTGVIHKINEFFCEKKPDNFKDKFVIWRENSMSHGAQAAVPGFVLNLESLLAFDAAADIRKTQSYHCYIFQVKLASHTFQALYLPYYNVTNSNYCRHPVGGVLWSVKLQNYVDLKGVARPWIHNEVRDINIL